MEIREADFEDVVLKSDRPVLVDFMASWCPPCKMIGPKFDAMSAEFPSVLFLKVDVDDAADAAEFAGISAMPTFKAYHNGSQSDELVGASQGNLRTLISKLAGL